MKSSDVQIEPTVENVNVYICPQEAVRNTVSFHHNTTEHRIMLYSDQW